MVMVVVFMTVVVGSCGQFGVLQSRAAQQHLIIAFTGVDVDRVFRESQLVQPFVSDVQPRFITVFVPGSIVCQYVYDWLYGEMYICIESKIFFTAWQN